MTAPELNLLRHRGLILTYAQPTHMNETHNQTKPNQTKPNQTKSNQTNRQIKYVFVFLLSKSPPRAGAKRAGASYIERHHEACTRGGRSIGR